MKSDWQNQEDLTSQKLVGPKILNFATQGKDHSLEFLIKSV